MREKIERRVVERTAEVAATNEELRSEIAERNCAEEDLRRQKEILQKIFDHLPVMISFFGADGRLKLVNREWERVSGWSLEELLSQDMDILTESYPKPQERQRVRDFIATADGEWADFRAKVRDGRMIDTTWTNVRLSDGTSVSIGVDITERKREEERIAHAAFHDALTGLPNRLLFIEHLKRTIAHGKRHKDYLFAVLFLDLDRFKIINDSLGHALADQLLVAIARKLEAVLRPEDVVARLGGDEFTILLDDIIDVSDTIHVAERIYRELQHPFHLDGHKVSTTASTGIALSTQGYDYPEEVLRDADTAMYRAKAEGLARYKLFDPSMHTRVMTRLKLEMDLKRAIERQEFQLHYQPIMSLASDQLTGFEALVRWQHPERGLIAPDEFIPIAEETGLVIQLGQWALYEACRQTRAWQDQYGTDQHPLNISVNISSKQFAQSDLVGQVGRVLEQTNLDARCLNLELTESVVMEKAEVAVAVLQELRALGVKLHIDDFGTGYSSLSYLHRFPVDMLKIDRSFVRRISPSEEDYAIVQSIIQLAHNLKMEVMAEGVETAEQRDQLKRLGCKYAQGHLFSEPVESIQAEALIARSHHR